MVALRVGVVGHWLELVGDLLLCRDQHVILIVGGTPVVRVEVHDEGGDVRGFSAYLGDAPRDDLVNDQPPIYLSDSGQSPEQGDGHGECYPLGLFRI